MPMTIVEKILSRGSDQDQASAGDIVTCRIDMAVLLDSRFLDSPSNPEGRNANILRMYDPSKVAVILDHSVPASTPRNAAGNARAREFVKSFGIEKFFDIGNHGICHQVIAEQGLAMPGTILACSDSHTCAAGALNCAARGLGAPEMTQILCTGSTWFKVPPTIRYDLIGELPAEVSGKDIFLYIAGHWGAATNKALEYGGPGLGSLPMGDRRTIATQGTEVGADYSLFPADQICFDYLGPKAEAYQPANPDAGAVYEDIRTITLDTLTPMIGLPGQLVHNTVPVDEAGPQKIDQCFIGSCANGKIEDIEVAAAMLRGRRVADGTRLIVTPASQQTYLEAVRRGFVETLVEAGAVVTNSTCGACFGGHMGVLGPHEVCLTSSTRNFKGRMGSPSAEIFMASPATVAASAVTGRITDPREMASAK